MALGSAAVVAVYAAGYLRTKPAADRLDAQSSMRRSLPPLAGAQEVPARPATPPVVEESVPGTTGDGAAAGSPATAAATAATLPATTAAMLAVPRMGGGSAAPTNPAAVTASAAPAVARDSVSALSAPPVPPPAGGAPSPGPVGVQDPSLVAAVTSTAATQTVTTTPAPVAAKTAAKASYKDGLFFGRGTSRHGDIESMIEISNGRIVSAVISQCLTQYSCRWIAALPPQVVARQSPDVDYVTGATESANAFYFSIVQALMQAK